MAERRGRGFLSGVAALLASLASPACAGQAPANARGRVEALVRKVERIRGLEDAPLGRADQVAFGTLMFRYLPADGTLAAAILVDDVDLWDKMGPEFARKYRIATAALSDPAIGGMFDTAGGSWLFEERTGRTYLLRTYGPDADPARVSRDIDAMAEVVPAWTMRWTAAVARIAHGHAPPPTRRVTLADDPYAGDL